MSPRKQLSAAGTVKTRIPIHTHAGKPAPARPTTALPRKPIRRFALIDLPAARQHGLLDARGALMDHDLDADALRAIAFDVCKDGDTEDDGLVSAAPFVLAAHNVRAAVAAQINWADPEYGLGDLTYIVEAADVAHPVAVAA